MLEADDFAGDFAMAVDDVRFGDHGGAVGLGDGGAVFFGGGIAIGGEADVLVLEEFSVGGVVFVGRNAQDQGVTRGDVPLETLQGGGFLDAGLAPGAPEIEDDDFAAIVGEMDGSGAVDDGEVWGGRGHLRGMRAAITAGTENQDGCQKC